MDYGGWSATSAEVLAVAKKLNGSCADIGWLKQAVEDCIVRLGKSNVAVMAGLMGGGTPQACVIEVSSAQWQGRRFIAFRNNVRDQATFFGFTSAFEITPKGPVQVTSGCQNDPLDAAGPKGKRLSPAGWGAMPGELKAHLCVGAL